MSVHRRGPVRALVVAVVTAIGLFGVASPAFAEDLGVTITELAGNIPSSSTNTTTPLSFEITGEGVQYQVQIQGAYLQCNGCSGIGTGTISTPLTVLPVPGDSPVSHTVTVTVKKGSDTETDSFTVTVSPPAKVPGVSGLVRDTFSAKPVGSVTVTIEDSAGHKYSKVTDDTGTFAFDGTASGTPIVAGVIKIRAEGDAIKPYVHSPEVTAQPGVAVAGLVLSVSPLTSSGPTGESTPSVTASANSTALVTDQPRDLREDGGNGLSFLLIGVGGFLVLLGIAAIVLLFLRRNGDDSGTPGKPGKPTKRGPTSGNGPRRPGGGAPRPPSGRGGDTVIARSPLAGPGSPPPGGGYGGGGYGGPPPAQPGYGAPPPAQPGYGAPPPAQPGYGAPPPAQPGYGAPPPAQPGYGAPPAQPGYGGGGYGAPTQAQPPAQPGYGQPYGSPPASPPSGYSAQPDYGAPYGGQPAGGYGAQPDPYAPPPGGYGAPYGQPASGGGGYGAQPPTQQQGGADGRRVDWVDD